MNEAGQHGYDGACMPGGAHECKSFMQETFSVGVFEWVAKSSGKGVKRGPVKVRVRGPFSEPEKVFDKAREIAAALDAGTYSGPKNVTVA